MYEVIDFFTNVIIVKTDDKNEINIAVEQWLKHNPSSCIEIFKDGVCIYG